MKCMLCEQEMFLDEYLYSFNGDWVCEECLTDAVKLENLEDYDSVQDYADDHDIEYDTTENIYLRSYFDYVDHEIDKRKEVI